ncbi:MAG: hypothetical protein HPY74_18040 [Firmicutes bacterium]|nr:hypothetical protein [Bacillota bacterium]
MDIKSYFDIDEEEDLILWTRRYNSAVARCRIGLSKIKNGEELLKLRKEPF